jgi:hypothetical protein
VAFATELLVDLADAVDAEVVVEDLLNQRLELLVPDLPRRGWAGLGGVVGARSDLGARIREGAADRLDSELASVLVDVVDQRGDGRSSSAAEKADALLRIALARRSSRFSRSSCNNRARSSLVRPGLSPASMRACWT